jgi:hypothetical protein
MKFSKVKSPSFQFGTCRPAVLKWIGKILNKCRYYIKRAHLDDASDLLRYVFSINIYSRNMKMKCMGEEIVDQVSKFTRWYPKYSVLVPPSIQQLW